jgi:hypothetical protein
MLFLCECNFNLLLSYQNAYIYIYIYEQVFREGRTKAVGNVLRLIPQSHPGAQVSRSKPNKMQSKQNSSNCVQQQTQQIIPAQALPSLPQTVQQVNRTDMTWKCRMESITSSKHANARTHTHTHTEVHVI